MSAVGGSISTGTVELSIGSGSSLIGEKKPAGSTN